MRPHRRQPTRLPRPWDSPGKNTGVGCHFLLQRVKVKSESEVAQSCPTLSDPMDSSLPGSSVHGTCQARGLEWGAIAFSVPPGHLPQKVSCFFHDPTDVSTLISGSSGFSKSSLNIWKFSAQVLFKPSLEQWHPTPVLLPGKSHGWRSLVGCCPRGL